MAFNQKEQSIIQWGTDNGKTGAEIQDALVRFRVTGSPQDPSAPPAPTVQPNVTQQPTLSSRLADVGETATTEIQESITGTGRAEGQSPLRRGFESTASAFNVPLLGAFELLPEPVRATLGVAGEGIGAGFSAVTDAISDRPEVQKFVTERPGATKAIEEAAGIGQAGGNIAGNILLADATSKVASGLAARAPEVLTPAGQSLVKAAGAISKGARPITSVLGDSTGYIAGRLPKALSIFTAESTEVIKAALRNPAKADVGIAGGDAALRAVIEEGAKNTIQIRSAFLQGYKLTKDNLLGEHGKVLVPKANIVKIFDDILTDEYKVKIGADGKLDFTVSRIKANPGEISKINNAREALLAWDEFTLSSLDEFKQFVGSQTKFAREAGGSSKSPALGRLHHELNQVAANRLPKQLGKDYAKLNKDFSTTFEMYNEVVSAFNSGDPFVRLANVFGKNKDALRGVLEFYAKNGGDDILPVIAGRELALEKSAAFGFLNPRSWVDFFISPKVQARITTGVGKALKKAKQ